MDSDNCHSFDKVSFCSLKADLRRVGYEENGVNIELGAIASKLSESNRKLKKLKIESLKKSELLSLRLERLAEEKERVEKEIRAL